MPAPVIILGLCAVALAISILFFHLYYMFDLKNEIEARQNLYRQLSTIRLVNFRGIFEEIDWLTGLHSVRYPKSKRIYEISLIQLGLTNANIDAILFDTFTRWETYIAQHSPAYERALNGKEWFNKETRDFCAEITRRNFDCNRLNYLRDKDHMNICRKEFLQRCMSVIESALRDYPVYGTLQDPDDLLAILEASCHHVVDAVTLMRWNRWKEEAWNRVRRRDQSKSATA